MTAQLVTDAFPVNTITGDLSFLGPWLAGIQDGIFQ
jgi:hypothetical protein